MKGIVVTTNNKAKEIVPAEQLDALWERELSKRTEQNIRNRAAEADAAMVDKLRAQIVAERKAHKAEINLLITGVSVFAGFVLLIALVLRAAWWTVFASALLIWLCGKKGGWW